MTIIESIKDKLKSQKDISVVFVHGIAASYNDWFKTAKTISENRFFKMRYIDENIFDHDYKRVSGNSVWTVSYYTRSILKESFFGDLHEYARRLQQIIKLISGLTGRKKTVIIAHSMGGLVARKYMTLSDQNWNSTHKILTVGTPNEGVITSIGVVGQLIDLRKDSEFITELKNDWKTKYDTKKWGVVGAVDRQLLFNYFLKKHHMIDSAGPGYVEISSSIPFGEWEDSLKNLNTGYFDTDNFGFRIAINANHWNLLHCNATFNGIDWALL